MVRIALGEMLGLFLHPGPGECQLVGAQNDCGLTSDQRVCGISMSCVQDNASANIRQTMIQQTGRHEAASEVSDYNDVNRFNLGKFRSVIYVPALWNLDSLNELPPIFG